MQKVEFGNWNNMQWQSTRPGARRVLLSTEPAQMTCVINELQYGCQAKPHSHEHEQISIILSGSCMYYIDGTAYELTAGSWIYNPPNVTHYSEVTSQDSPLMILDVFAPTRDDFVESFKKFIGKE